jgi:hypothetical protein
MNDPVSGRASFRLKAYRVRADGFPAYLYFANSRGKALRDAWHGYCSYRPVSFKDFLRIARSWGEKPQDEDFGAPLTVDGRQAFYVSRNTQYVQVAWPDSDGYSNAHPLEIEPQRFRPPAYRTEQPPAPQSTDDREDVSHA